MQPIFHSRHHHQNLRFASKALRYDASQPFTPGDALSLQVPAMANPEYQQEQQALASQPAIQQPQDLQASASQAALPEPQALVSQPAATLAQSQTSQPVSTPPMNPAALDLSQPMPDIPHPSNVSVNPRYPFNFQFQQFQQFHPQQVVKNIRNMPPDKLYQNAQNLMTLTEFLPVAIPGTAYAPPLLSTAYAGYDVYKTARNQYEKYKDLDPQERWRKTAEKTGEKAMYHLMATLLFPALIATTVYKRLEKLLAKSWMPKFIQNSLWTQRILKTMGTVGILIAVGGLVSKAARFILDWTYRPLVRNKKPEQWDMVASKLQEWRDKVTGQFQPQYPPRPPAKFDWPDDRPPLQHPNTFNAMFS